MDISTWLLTLLGTTPFDSVTNPHPYAMVRGGGLFIMVMGLGTMIGTIRPWLILPMIGTAFVIGFILIGTVGVQLTREMGTLSDFQATMVYVGLAVEVIAITLWSIFIIPKEGVSRRYLLGILIIVGAHFLLFFPAQGWLVVVLALACMGWAGYALRNERISISAAYFVDGVIKVVSGLAMVLFYPV